MAKLTKNTVFFYHKHCVDGFGAAWAARAYLHDSADYVAIAHGDSLPELASPCYQVVFGDFCPKRSVLHELLEDGRSVTILDHHKTSKAELEGFTHKNLTVVFDMNRSGAVITWEYYMNRSPVPELLLWVQDRDLWRKDLVDTPAVTEALRAYPFEFDVWDALNVNKTKLVASGEVLLMLKAKRIDQILGRVYLSTVGGHIVPTINTDSYVSDIGNRLCKEYPDHPFSATWFLEANGTRKYSLRSIGEFDVSEIAKEYGGGGHRNASGFICP